MKELKADTAMAIVSQTPAVLLIDDTGLCSGDSIAVDAGAGYTSYDWSTGDTTQSVMLMNGTHIVTTEDNIGCISSDTVVIEDYTQYQF